MHYLCRGEDKTCVENRHTNMRKKLFIRMIAKYVNVTRITKPIACNP